MARRWEVKDENWFWFIAVSPGVNLWPCRWCGAMVMGVQTEQHEKFHEKVGRPSTPAGETL